MIKDKVVLITGASRGVGLGIAKELGSRGASIAINCGTSEGELNSALGELKSQGIRAAAIMGDVSSYAACENLVNETRETLGRIDVLINNAAIAHYGLFTQTDTETWNRLFAVNVQSVFNLSHIVLPQMIREKSGRIINISSIWGEMGASMETVYSATKGAVNAFTKALAKEVAPSGIYVNAISLGVMDTKMNDNLDDEEKDALRQSIGLGRFGSTKDAGFLCAYLMESEYMTGEILKLDGGF